MKIKIMLLIACLFFVQCKQTILKTTVIDKKNVIRTVQTSGDSLGVGDVEYPFPTDELWTMTKEKSKDDDGYVYSTTRTFHDVNTLNLYCRDDSAAVSSHVELYQKFRWFFTYYSYHETVPTFNTFDELPMEDFLNEQEYQIYLTDPDSSDYEDKVEKWLFSMMFEVLWNDLEKAAPNADAKFTDSYLKEKKTSIYNSFFDDDSGDSFLQDDLISEYLAIMDSLLQPSQSFLSLRPHFAKSEEKITNWFTAMGNTMGQDFELYVKMPGRVVDTNAIEIDSTKTNVSWGFDSDQFLMRDYKMWVDSRKFNTMPTAATGIFFLLGLIFLFKPKKEDS